MRRGSIGRWGTPTAPRTVKSTPLERWTSYPTSTSDSMTFWTFSSLAVCSITMTMDTLVSSSSRRPSASASASPGQPLQAPALVDDALEDAPHRPAVERAGVVPLRAVEDPLLPLGLVDGHPDLPLDPADLHRARRAAVQQLHELVVDLVDAPAQVVHLRLAPRARTRRPRPLGHRRGPRRLRGRLRRTLRLPPMSCSSAISPSPEVAPRVLLQEAHERAPDHHPVGHRRRLAHLLRRREAEAEGHRHARSAPAAARRAAARPPRAPAAPRSPRCG